MRRQCRKLLYLLLAVIMCAFALIGCQDRPGTLQSTNAPVATAGDTARASQATPDATTPQAPGDPDAPDPDTRYRISWVGYQTAPLGDDPFVLRYLEDIFNVDFDIWNLDFQQFDDLLNIRLASGEIPDMFMVRQPSNLTMYVQQEVLHPIPYEDIVKYMPNTLEISWTITTPNALDLGKVNGEIYGMPAMNTGNRFRLPVVYNQNWLEATGKEVPVTIADFEEVIYAFAKDNPTGTGQKTYGLSNDGLLLLWGMYGMVPEQDYFAVKDGKLVYPPIEPEMKEALATANKWYNDGVLDPEFITGENFGGYWAVSHPFVNQRIGVTVRGNYYHWLYDGDFEDRYKDEMIPNQAGACTKELLAVSPDARISFGQPLIDKDGNQGGVRAYNMLMRFYCVGADAEKEPGKVNKILQIYEYCSDAQPDDIARIEVRNGFLDEQWEWADQENARSRALEPYLSDGNLRYEIGCILWWSSGNTTRPESAQAQWAEEKGFHLNPIFSDMPISTPAMARYNSMLQTLREQAYIQIITGEKPLDYFDTFVAEYLRQGGEEILAEGNEWLAGQR